MKAWFAPPPLTKRLEALKRDIEHELLDAEFYQIAYKMRVEELQAKLAFINIKLEKTSGY